ncbi:AraC family transcriptional regulator [Aquidulcibacter sp.]|uniref:helix-turn-helix domain-containing protein n=1 Tax=Aquidulcibacter sp. TaxID=2052990 RepID=UPI0025C3F07E|nr:helix-turn-helix domain-containing protein [Aquidulcibacter sp.]MCA3696462.1 AraC family transcriptional regulator [Aquidulcibacter sp.]
MISFGTLSISLLLLAGQSVVLAGLLWIAPNNRAANRFLGLLILAIALMVTPYIIGFAGFYDTYPWLSFAPLSTSLSFGPLLYLHIYALIYGHSPKKWGLHLVPYGVQFLSQALVFPLPLPLKNAWDSFAHAKWIDPFLTLASLVSIGLYGTAIWRLYQAYRHHLAQTRADDAQFDPSWVRNAVFGVMGLALVWFGFFMADQLDPSRNYFDDYWMYMGVAALGVYLGVAGWRNSGVLYPLFDASLEPVPDEGEAPSPSPERDWQAMGAQFATVVEAEAYWRDPDLTLASLARKLGTNTTYVSRALNEGLGQSFSAFINARRVKEAQALLVEKAQEADLMAIAFDAGFNSKASFNRAFSEFAGMSPSAWRRGQRLKS